MTNYNERLDEIAVDLLVKYGKLGTMDEFVPEAKQAILDWHNKQVEEVLDRLESERDSHDADTGCSDELGYIPLSAIQAERNKLKERNDDQL